jgi:hypothetical protein
MSGFEKEVDKAIKTAEECKWALKTQMCRHFKKGKCD